MATKKPSKRALNCVFLMINADKPTLAEYEAARNAGFIDITRAGLDAHIMSRVLKGEDDPTSTALDLDPYAALADLLGDQPSIQNHICIHCGREYADDIESGDCPSDDCPSFNARRIVEAHRSRMAEDRGNAALAAVENAPSEAPICPYCGSKNAENYLTRFWRCYDCGKDWEHPANPAPAEAEGTPALVAAFNEGYIAIMKGHAANTPAADWAGCCRASQRIWQLFNAMQKGTPADLRLAPTSTTAEIIASELGIALPGE